VETELRAKYGVTLVAPLGFENAYALAMKRSRAEELGIRRVSDLGRHATVLSIGGDYEFFERAEWRSIQSVYAIVFAEQRSMDPSLMYQAVAQGDVDVISAFSTDGRIAALDLVVLEDDRGAIPPYDAIILASPGAPERWPAATAALASLRGKIDSSKMRAMNRAVDQDGRAPADVAAEFLRSD
jgi:osmoprotectant transport system permease protein